MKRFTFTPRGYEELKRLITQVDAEYRRTMREGYESGAEQDGHHDETFQHSLSTGAMHLKRLTDLQTLLAGAEVIHPLCQNEVVRIGNVVVVENEDGARNTFVLDGYLVSTDDKSRSSIYSPIGKAILGARKGEEREITIGNKEKVIRIIDILIPLDAAPLNNSS